jgi:hypothetical protein
MIRLRTIAAFVGRQLGHLRLAFCVQALLIDGQHLWKAPIKNRGRILVDAWKLAPPIDAVVDKPRQVDGEAERPDREGDCPLEPQPR